MIPSWAKVGAKAVCVDASPSEDGIQSDLIYGHVYTIKKVWPLVLNITQEWADCAIDLVESGIDFPDRSFWVKRFRPIVIRTQEQDAEAFRKMLSSMPVSTTLDELERLLERTP